MAWTAPRTWVLGEVLTASLLNTHVRDNELSLTQHQHTGAAGDGDDQLSGIDDIIFDDAAAPAAPGASKTRLYSVSGYPHYREGAAGADKSLYTPTLSDTLANRPAAGHAGLTYHETDTRKVDRDTGAAFETIVDADAAAATPSLRTLGTGATQAAVGTHTHGTVHDAQGDSLGVADIVTISISTASNRGEQLNLADSTEYDLESISITLAASGAIEACGVVVHSASHNDLAVTLRLYIDGVLAASSSPTTLVTGSVWTIKGNRVAASGARIVKIAVLTGSVGASKYINHIDYVFAGVNKV